MWLTVKEMAEKLEVSEKTIRRRMKAGEWETREVKNPKGGMPIVEIETEPTGQSENVHMDNWTTGQKSTGQLDIEQLDNWTTGHSVDLPDHDNQDNNIDKKIDNNLKNPPKKEPVSDLPAFIYSADYNREPTNKEICMMCHFSSNCGNCCKTCKEQCNGKQYCQIGIGGQADRLESWMKEVIENDNFTHLRKFINTCYNSDDNQQIDKQDITKTVNKNILLKDSHSIATKENSKLPICSTKELSNLTNCSTGNSNLTKVTNCSPIMPGSDAILPALSSECVCSAEDNSNLPNCSTAEPSNLTNCSTAEPSNLPNCSTIEPGSDAGCSPSERQVACVPSEKQSRHAGCVPGSKSREIEILLENKIDLREKHEIPERYEEIAKLRASFCEKVIVLVKNSESKLTAWQDIKNAYDNDLFMKKLKDIEGEKSVRTFRRWVETYLDNKRDYRALVPDYNIKEKGRIIPEQAKNLLIIGLLNPKKPAIKAIISNIRFLERMGKIENIECSDRTLLRWAEEYLKNNKGINTLAREGEKSYLETFEKTLLRDDSLIEVGDVWFADGHVLAFDIIDPETGKAKRMTWIPFMDWKSRMILGASLAVTENANHISEALRYSILNTRYTPKVVYIDNGKAFRSKLFHDPEKHDLEEELGGIYQRLGIEVVFAKPFNAKAKVIERFFRTFQEGFERFIDSFRGSSIADKPAYLNRNEKFIKKLFYGEPLEISEAKQLIDIYIFQVYGMNKHSGIGNKRPLEVLRSAVIPEERFIKPSQLNYLMLTRKERKVSNNGIYLYHFKLWYWDEALLDHVGEEVLVKYDYFNLQSVLVYDKKNRQICQAFVRELQHPLVSLDPNKEISGEKLSRELKEIASRKKKAKKLLTEEIDQVDKAIEKMNLGNILPVSDMSLYHNSLKITHELKKSTDEKSEEFYKALKNSSENSSNTPENEEVIDFLKIRKSFNEDAEDEKKSLFDLEKLGF